MSLELSINSYYLDATGRAWGPMLMLPEELNTSPTRQPQFYVKARGYLDIISSRWNLDGTHTSGDEEYQLTQEFVPAISNAEDFGVPSDGFGYVLEALSQIPAMPDGPMIEDPDNEIVAFSYRQFHAFSEFFGLFKSPEEKLQSVVEAFREKHGKPGDHAVAAVFLGSESEGREIKEAVAVAETRIKLRRGIDRSASEINDNVKKYAAGMKGLDEAIARLFGVPMSLLDPEDRQESKVRINEMYGRPRGQRLSPDAIAEGEKILRDAGYTGSFEDDCSCANCKARRSIHGKLTREANVYRLLQDLEHEMLSALFERKN